MIQLSIIVMVIVGSLFLCSFSSILSAILLIFSTLSVINMMYWNLVNSIPLYLFSLFMLGGLYVLIGFVMMADMSDMDMIMSSGSMEEFVCSFMCIMLGLKFSGALFNSLDFDLINFSPIKANDWSTWGPLSSVFLFLILVLFIYLFMVHMMMKSSSSGGGFVM